MLVVCLGCRAPDGWEDLEGLEEDGPPSPACFEPLSDVPLHFDRLPADLPFGAVSHSIRLVNTCDVTADLPVIRRDQLSGVLARVEVRASASRVGPGEEVELTIYAGVRAGPGKAVVALVDTSSERRVGLVEIEGVWSRLLPAVPWVSAGRGCRTEFVLDLHYSGSRPVEIDQLSWQAGPGWSVSAPSFFPVRLERGDMENVRIEAWHDAAVEENRSPGLTLTVEPHDLVSKLQVGAGPPELRLSHDAFLGEDIRVIRLGVRPEPDSLEVTRSSKPVPFTYDPDTLTLSVEAGAGIVDIRGVPACL